MRERKTIEEDLPAEADYLRRYDEFRAAVEVMADMPDETIDFFASHAEANNGAGPVV